MRIFNLTRIAKIGFGHSGQEKHLVVEVLATNKITNKNTLGLIVYVMFHTFHKVYVLGSLLLLRILTIDWPPVIHLIPAAQLIVVQLFPAAILFDQINSMTSLFRHNQHKLS